VPVKIHYKEIGNLYLGVVFHKTLEYCSILGERTLFDKETIEVVEESSIDGIEPPYVG